MRRKGQSILEYAIILAIIVGVIVFVGRGLFHQNLETALSNASTRIGTEAAGLLQ